MRSSEETYDRLVRLKRQVVNELHDAEAAEDKARVMFLEGELNGVNMALDIVLNKC